MTKSLTKESRELRRDLETLPGVVGVHQVRVWEDAHKSLELSVHLVVLKPNVGFIARVREVARLYGIAQVTVQLETPELSEAEEHGHPRWHF
jgi:Co/Zn/Cd efflux system component